MSLEAKGGEAFQTPRGACVPFGVMELALAELPAQQQERYRQLLAASEAAPLQELDSIAQELQVRTLGGPLAAGCACCGLLRMRSWQAVRACCHRCLRAAPCSLLLLADLLLRVLLHHHHHHHLCISRSCQA